MIDPVLIDRIVDRTLSEDLESGDLTTEATVPSSAAGSACAIAKQPLVACGASVFARVFYRLDPGCRVEEHVADGEFVPSGTVLWEVEGSAQSILMGERSALNLVQRLSGIASLAAKYVQALPAGSATRITDTRKTTPGLRALERYAVRSGGAHNHRDSLGSAVLIKDNHIAAVGSITEAVTRARKRAPHCSKIEVEVRSLAELDEALAAGADIVLLDNMDTAAIAEAVKLNAGRALLEVSGGVTLERIPELAALNVDVISVGALTHSAPAADISLLLELIGSP